MLTYFFSRVISFIFPGGSSIKFCSLFRRPRADFGWLVPAPVLLSGLTGEGFGTFTGTGRLQKGRVVEAVVATLLRFVCAAKLRSTLHFQTQTPFGKAHCHFLM